MLDEFEVAVSVPPVAGVVAGVVGQEGRFLNVIQPWLKTGRKVSADAKRGK